MIRGNDLIQLSNRWSQLKPPSGSEAVWRTAIGRAYYGAFHTGAEFLKEIEVSFPSSREKRNDHGFVHDAFQQAGVPALSDFAAKLASLHEYRKKADYRLAELFEDAQQVAILCYTMAEDVSTELQACDMAARTVAAIRINEWQRRYAGRA